MPNMDKEWVLNGDTVLYGTAENLMATLGYDFEQEKKFKYKGISKQDVIEHLAQFISSLWQIHIFGEGNTRTVAIFLIKYLRTFGFEVNNNLFAEHSWYFRNALVRANYRNYAKNIAPTLEFLMRFFENLSLDKKHILKNRMMHIQYSDPVNDPVNDPVKTRILQQLEQNSKANYQDLAKNTGYSTTTIKRHIQELKKMGKINRIGSDKTGHWEIVDKI